MNPGFFVDNNSYPKEIRYEIQEVSGVEFKVFIQELEGAKRRLLLYKLIYIEHDKLGFAQYRIEINNAISYKPMLVWESTSTNLYRVFKKVFHNHKFHQEGEYFINEKLLFSQQQIEVKEKIRKYYPFYVKQIQRKLTVYTNYLSATLRDKVTPNSFIYWPKFNNKRKLFFIRGDFNKLLGISDYLEILAQHTHFRTDIAFFRKEVEYLRSIRNDLNEDINDQRSNISFYVGILGFGIGLLSLSLSLFWSNKNKKSQNQFEELIEHAHYSDSVEFFKLKENLANYHFYSQEEFDSLCVKLNKVYCNSKDSIFLLLNKEHKLTCPNCTTEVVVKRNLN